MTAYPLLVDPERVKDWARQLVGHLERRDAEERARFGRIVGPEISANAVTLDLVHGDTFWITLDQDLTTWTILKPRATDRQRFDCRLGLEQDGTGSHAVTWPGEFVWDAGGAPTMTVTAGAKDIFELSLINEVIYARTLGQGF